VFVKAESNPVLVTLVFEKAVFVKAFTSLSIH